MNAHEFTRYLRQATGPLAVSCLLVLASAPVPAGVELELSGNDVSELGLAVGKSEVLRSATDLREVVVGNPAVADIKLLSSRQVLILGRKAGRTNVVFRDRGNRVAALMDVVVGYDIEALKRRLHDVMPDEKAIEVRSAGDKIMLSGEASSALAMESALLVARSFVDKKEEVVNLMSVGGGQQVMLEARIAEVARSAVKDLGVQTRITSDNSNFAFDLLTGVALQDPFGVGTVLGNDYALRLNALETQGLARILAEPNLVAMSGHEAEFLAGGEFPVPEPQDFGSVGILYKEFGVALKFTPTVLTGSKINLRLRAEVSAIDESTRVSTIAGASLPGLTTRRAATTVEVGDGQGFAIAGLLQRDMNNFVQKFPGLGEIPVLGALFRSTDFQRNETELVIIVVPRLVKPLPANRYVLPTDGVIPPSDLDQYLLGNVEAQPPAQEDSAREGTPTPKGGVEGQYGHQL